jgi:hypothetical protein
MNIQSITQITGSASFVTDGGSPREMPNSSSSSSIGSVSHNPPISGRMNEIPLADPNDAQSEIEALRLKVTELELELDGVSNKGKLIAQELDLFRQRRVVFWSDRFRNAFDAWNLMNPNFQQLKDDSAMFHGEIQPLRLQPSLSLLRVPFLSYNFKLNRAGLKGIFLAPVLDVPLQVGELCVRLFSERDNLIACSSKNVTHMSDEEPVLFDFAPIKNSHEIDMTLRIYVQGVDAPVRIFELRRYALAGFGRLQSRPFAGYVFD